jgi:hypothetical protein
MIRLRTSTWLSCQNFRSLAAQFEGNIYSVSTPEIEQKLLEGTVRASVSLLEGFPICQRHIYCILTTSIYVLSKLAGIVQNCVSFVVNSDEQRAHLGLRQCCKDTINPHYLLH